MPHFRICDGHDVERDEVAEIQLFAPPPLDLTEDERQEIFKLREKAVHNRADLSPDEESRLLAVAAALEPPILRVWLKNGTRHELLGDDAQEAWTRWKVKSED